MPTQKKAHMLRNWSKRDEHLRYVVSYQFTASNDPLLLPAIAALRTRFMGSDKIPKLYLRTSTTISIYYLKSENEPSPTQLMTSVKSQ